jgi:hypothetical protein
MKYLILLLFVNFAIADNNITKNYSKPNDKVSNIENNMMLLKQEIEYLKDNFQVKLDVEKRLNQVIVKNNIKEFEYLIKKQDENHERELEYQKEFFWIFITIITVIAFFLGFNGIEYMEKKTKEFIKNNHYNETKKLVDELANNKDFIKIIQAEQDNIVLKNNDKSDEDDSNQFS